MFCRWRGLCENSGMRSLVCRRDLWTTWVDFTSQISINLSIKPTKSHLHTSSNPGGATAAVAAAAANPKQIATLATLVAIRGTCSIRGREVDWLDWLDWIGSTLVNSQMWPAWGWRWPQISRVASAKAAPVGWRSGKYFGQQSLKRGRLTLPRQQIWLVWQCWPPGPFAPLSSAF